ncbi:MAG TPA: outer membrane beta-barrel protein [Gammaproteobacteria bacterium]|nr:outer membrane beta-barrel protein [Gammaproteobacteria bacterium]
MGRYTGFLGIALVLLLASSTAAAGYDSYETGGYQDLGWQGFYMGGGAGKFRYQQKGSYRGNPYSMDKTDTAYKGIIGYRFLPFIGMEVSYEDLGTATKRLKNIAVADKLKVRSRAWTGYMVGYLPVEDVLDLFGKVGLAAWQTDTKVTAASGGKLSSTSHEGTDFAWGLGAQVNFPSDLSLRGEYERIEYDPPKGPYIRSRDSSLITGSLLLHF